MTAGTGLLLLVLAVCLVAAALDRRPDRRDVSFDEHTDEALDVVGDPADWSLWEAGR